MRDSDPAIRSRLQSTATLLGLVLFIPSLVIGQPDSPNYSEEFVPEYSLPDPLRHINGTTVSTPELWWSTRRPEILSQFEQNMYGKIPPAILSPPLFKVVECGTTNFGDGAIRKQVEITLTASSPPLTMTLLLYTPRTGQPVPTFLGLNFYGNQTVADDSEIIMNKNWMRANPAAGIVNHRATEQSRGIYKNRWQIEKVLARGYGVATVYYGDIAADQTDCFQHEPFKSFYSGGQSRPKPEEWGAISAWAWGLSRAVDYLVTDDSIDPSKIAVLGHSRLGKSALWAAASDPRFSMAISNNSGCGGAALSRRRFGETVSLINTACPHWFCDQFKTFNNAEERLPIDQHLLICLLAPRPVYIASAEEDLWADPRGEFLSAWHALPVYRLLETEGFGIDVPQTQPAVNVSLKQGTIGYHMRSGKHDVTADDWNHFLDFADLHFKNRKQ